MHSVSKEESSVSGVAAGGNAYKREKKARGANNSGSIAKSSSRASGTVRKFSGGGPSHGNSTIESDAAIKFQH